MQQFIRSCLGLYSSLPLNREEKSLPHVAIVAKFWMTTIKKCHLKVYSHYFKLHWSYSISFNLANLGKNFLWGHVYCYLNWEKFCVVFTYSIKRACEIGKFHVIVAQWRKRNVQNNMMHVQSCCFCWYKHIIFCRSPWRDHHRWFCCHPEIVLLW